jgi:hypothetical protein
MSSIAIPTEIEVWESVTSASFRLDNWRKHLLDDRYGGHHYPYSQDFVALDSKPFSRRTVFKHFEESVSKGIISAIKWGYPTGGRPGGSWQAFSTAFRDMRYADLVGTLLAQEASLATSALVKLNAILPGIGTATTTKIAYFAGLKVEIEHGKIAPCLIYDSMVRRAIKHGHEETFASLREVLNRHRRDLPPKQQQDTYASYLTCVCAFAEQRRVLPAQIELWLFRAGRKIDPVSGTEKLKGA